MFHHRNFGDGLVVAWKSACLTNACEKIIVLDALGHSVTVPEAPLKSVPEAPLKSPCQENKIINCEYLPYMYSTTKMLTKYMNVFLHTAPLCAHVQALIPNS